MNIFNWVTLVYKHGLLHTSTKHSMPATSQHTSYQDNDTLSAQYTRIRIWQQDKDLETMTENRYISADILQLPESMKLKGGKDYPAWNKSMMNIVVASRLEQDLEKEDPRKPLAVGTGDENATEEQIQAWKKWKIGDTKTKMALYMNVTGTHLKEMIDSKKTHQPKQCKSPASSQPTEDHEGSHPLPDHIPAAGPPSRQYFQRALDLVCR